MIIESLRAKNFMRFSDFELGGMPGGGLVGIFGDNECGKSTIGQMLSYALFGRTPKAPGGDPAVLVNWSESEAMVDLTFLLGHDRFRIVRELSKDGEARAKLINLTIDEVIAENGENLEKEIEYLLGYSFREFRYSTFIGQKELDLILHSTEDRKLVLNNMLGVGFMDRMSRKVADKRKYHETEFRVHQRRITDKEEVLDVYLSRKKDLERIEARRDAYHKDLVESIRERERTASTVALLEDIRKKKEKFDILDMRIKDRREHLRLIEMEISELMRDADSLPGLKQESREKDELIQEIRGARLREVEDKLEKVESYKDLQKKIDDNDGFIARKEETLRGLTAKLEEIERKSRECRELEKKRDDLDYLIESFLEERRFRSTTSHLIKDIELVGSELDKVRSSLKKDQEMVREREKSVRNQLGRLGRQREAVATDEVNQEELIKVQGNIDKFRRRRDGSLILDGVIFAGSLTATVFFAEIIYLAGLFFFIPVSIYALISQGKLQAARQKVGLAQQQLYAFNISQRGLQELDETEEELADELNGIVEKREAINDRLTAMSYFDCEDFGRVEKSIEEIKKLDEPSLTRARELMESMLTTYDKLKKVLPEKIKFSEIQNLNVGEFIEEKKNSLAELDEKMGEVKEFIKQKEHTINQIESLNSEIGTARDMNRAYRSKQGDLRVTAEDEGPLNVEKKEIALQCEQLRREIEENKRRLKMIEAQAERVRELEVRRKDIVREIDADLINYYELREATRDIDCSEDKFSLLYERHEYLEKKVEDMTATLHSIDREKKVIERDMSRAANVRKEILALQKEARTAEEHIIKYRELETLFIKTGMDIKKRLVPQVESYFGWILPRMTRGRYQKVLLSDEFDVRVFSYEKDDYVALDVLSGGTVDQLLISLRLAFARAATTNALHPNRFLFLDEPFSSFDQSRRELFFNLLQTLKPNFKQIFLISHLPNLEEFVDHYIHVDLTGEKQPVIYSWK